MPSEKKKKKKKKERMKRPKARPYNTGTQEIGATKEIEIGESIRFALQQVIYEIWNWVRFLLRR